MAKLSDESKGYTIFRQVGVQINYTEVDLAKQQVTSTISYENEVKVTVITDLLANQVFITGSFEEVIALALGLEKEDYLMMFEDWARVFIENKVTDPEAYMYREQD